jgi:hypothetical protein
MPIPSLPKLSSLQNNLPIEGAVRIELAEGISLFTASNSEQIKQGQMQIDRDRDRSNRLAAKLRALGIDPDEV